MKETASGNGGKRRRVEYQQGFLRPRLEELEPRCILSTFLVDSFHDAPSANGSDGAGALFVGFEDHNPNMVCDITAVDVETGEDVGSVLPFEQVGAFYLSDVLYAEDRLFVLSAVGFEATIYSFDPAAGEMVQEGEVTIPVGNYDGSPDDMAYDPVNNHLYVGSVGPNELSVFDLDTHEDLGCPIRSGNVSILDICWGNGRLYILDYTDGGRICELNAQYNSGTGTWIGEPNPLGTLTHPHSDVGEWFYSASDNLTYDPGGNDLYVSSFRFSPNELIRFDLDSMTDEGCPITSGSPVSPTQEWGPTVFTYWTPPQVVLHVCTRLIWPRESLAL